MLLKLNIVFPNEDTPNWIEPIDAVPELLDVFLLPDYLALESRDLIFLLSQIIDVTADRVVGGLDSSL